MAIRPPVFSRAMLGVVGTQLARRGDLALLALVIAIIALMLLPMPPAALDALIAVNIAVSIGLLMLAIYVPSSLGLSTFPSLLLFTTLLRLSLNIASTKQILLNAHAGQIIETFGKFVVGGSVVVGIVVFVIIAIVQFIVIAKGSERVAEVGARFTLDGMPGKQMSIDADLRAGLISKDEARRRRSNLEQESQFFGAMDGAMKFVKGDAIAAMIIAFVNIVAGIGVGMAIKNMAFADALARYTVLTVGDGMVSQIPSLFVSIAAGVLITRVGVDESRPTDLGTQIFRQVLDQPLALILTAVVLLAFVVTPGFPKAQFGFIAVVLLLVAGWVMRRPARRKSFANTPMASMAREGSREKPPMIRSEPDVAIAPLSIRLASDCEALLDPNEFDQALSAARQRVRRDLGIPFPGLVLRYDPTLREGRYAIDVHELPRSGGQLRAGRFVETARAAEFAAGSAQPVATWGPFRDGVWTDGVPVVDQEDGPRNLSAGEVLATHVEWVLQQQPDLFIGFPEAHLLLEEVGRASPELVQELQRSVPLQRITDVLRRLVQESISIRPIREICESLLTWGPREKDPVLLTEYVRIDLGRYIAYRFGGGARSVGVYMLDPLAEQAIRQAVQQTNTGAYLALGPDDSRRLVDAVDRVLQQKVGDTAPVLMASMDIRRYVRRLLETRFPQLAVLSYQEIGSHLTLQTLGRVGFDRAVAA